MNIFYLDTCPTTAASYMVDRHVVKMILESAQILSTAHRLLDGRQETININSRNRKVYSLDDQRDPVLYKATHVNHPSAAWVRESSCHYKWLLDHFNALMSEYTFRYGKSHACESRIADALSAYPNNIHNNGWTPPPLCMPDEYKVNDPVQSYRNYYKFGKSSLHSWKKRLSPDWIN